MRKREREKDRELEKEWGRENTIENVKIVQGPNINQANPETKNKYVRY